LHAQGYPRLPIRLRVRETPRVEARLRRRGVGKVEDLSAAKLLAIVPRDSHDDIYLAATVRSLARYFEARGLLVSPPTTPGEIIVGEYRAHLDHVRGLSEATFAQHASTESELLALLRYDVDSDALRRLATERIDVFVETVASLSGRCPCRGRSSFCSAPPPSGEETSLTSIMLSSR
jgi:hypothetical protein